MRKQQEEVLRDQREQNEKVQEQMKHLFDAMQSRGHIKDDTSTKQTSTLVSSSQSSSSSDAVTPRLNSSARKKAAFVDDNSRQPNDDDTLDREQEVNVSDDDDDRHAYVSYNEWLRLRQLMYPVADPRYRQHYTHRCSLLSLHGRHNEYYRFGLRVRFPKKLYPSAYLQWFEIFRKDFGDLPSTRRVVRSSAVDLIKTLTIPMLIYERGELPRRTASYDDNDLSENSVTLKSLGLPDELLIDLRRPSIWHYSPPSLMEAAIRCLTELTHRVSGENATTHTAHENQASVSDFRIKSQDVRHHAGHTSSSLEIPEYDDNYNIHRSRSVPHHGSGPGALSRSSSAAARINSSFNNNNNNNTSSARPPASSVNVSRDQLPADYNPRDFDWMNQADWSQVPHLEQDSFSDPYGSMQRMKQESDRSKRDNITDREFRNEHVLGDIIDMFDEQTRSYLKLTRQTRALSAGDLQKAIHATIGEIGAKFDGTADKAPQYFHNLITCLSKYQFTSSDVISIIKQTLTGSATPWFMSAIMDVTRASTNDARNLVPMLLGLFREQYMNNTHVIQFRNRLTEMKITDRYVTTKELQQHYGRFQLVANNLKLCDKSMSNEVIKQTYVESLPPVLRTYIGIGYKDSKTVDNVYQLAVEACHASAPKKKVDLDGEDLSVNSLYLSDNDDGDDGGLVPELDNQHVWFMAFNLRNRRTPIAKEDVDCWHCGGKGHFAGECPLHAKNLPQTTKGALKYATFNKTRGVNRIYDAEYQKQRSKQIRDRREGNSGGRRSNNNRRRRIKPVDEDGDVESVNTLMDAVQVQSHIIELYDQSDDDDDTDSEEAVKHVVQLSSIVGAQNNNSTLQQVRQREKADASVATSMCLPIEVNGVAVGYALGDQGATKSIIRASALDKLGVNVLEHAVKNHYVVCANGSEVPIRSRFNAMITSSGKQLGDSLVYVVDDSGDKDITCDMVLGRSTMASSRFNCIDTKKGSLFDKQTGDEIQCLPAQFISVHSKHHLVPLNTSVSTVIPSFGQK
jgi:hypothetical protein